MENCIFCKIVKKQAPSSVEFEDEDVIAIKSIQPVAETHILIIPKIHVSSFLEIDKEILSNLMEVAQKLITDHRLQEGYKLVINGGKYQGVAHFHWHLLGGKFKDATDVLNNT